MPEPVKAGHAFEVVRVTLALGAKVNLMHIKRHTQFLYFTKIIRSADARDNRFNV